MNKLIFLIFHVLLGASCLAQKSSGITGSIASNVTQKTIEGAEVRIELTNFHCLTDLTGKFKLEGDLPLGEQILKIEKDGFTTQRIPIVIELNKFIELSRINLKADFISVQKGFANIDLTSEQLDSDEESFQNQNLLQASRDPFLSSVAFNWSATFFKLRGLGSEHAKILINGIEVNKLYNNRPNWSNWSGLNDILRSQEMTLYTDANPYNFGGPLGVTNLKFQSSQYPNGSKLSFASTNRSYKGRLMATYHSGQLPNGWSFSLSASARAANQGYVNGTNVRALSIFASAEKQINKQHSISFTSIYTPVIRGKSSPNTREVTGIKGIRYNSYWGFQNNNIRNSRIKKVQEPIITLSHYWKPSSKLNFQNSVLFQKGKIGNSRLDYTGKTVVQTNNNTFFEGGGRNPDPAYYQILPSYFTRNKGDENYEAAFLADRSFRSNGQLDWNFLYNANSDTGKNAAYVLYEDRNDDTSFAINSIIDYQISDKISVQGKLAFRKLNSENFAEVIDLFGSSPYLDIDSFSEGDEAQNDLQHPNRLVKVNDKFKYNYDLQALEVNSFAQLNYTYKKWDLSTAFSIKGKQYQREGKYENGFNSKSLSLGKSRKLSFIGYGFKLNLLRQISPKLFGKISVFTAKEPPLLQHSFTNPRQNNNTVSGLNNETIFSADVNMIYKFAGVKYRLSGYLIEQKNVTNRSFFFTDNLAGLGRIDNAGFFQEIMTGINKQNVGLEFGAELALTSTLGLNLSAALGNHRYINNPNLYISSNTLPETLKIGRTFLKNYHLSTGPQRAYGLGFNYRDPNYWWFTSQLNFFSHSFSNISPFTRSKNFVTDIDGQPFSTFDEEKARELLMQERFPAYFLWNVIGGKSWKLKNGYLGIVVGLQNILNQVFITGAFEQSRNSNFNTLRADRARNSPLFGSKYWYGSGTTFYFNTYYRF